MPLQHPVAIAILSVLTATAVIAVAVDKETSSPPAGMAKVEGGEFRPLFLAPGGKKERVDTFLADKLPVTNKEFHQFVQQHPQWRKENIAKLFAEDSYLSHWSKVGDQWQPAGDIERAPVTNVSWFAATAYCEARGKQLPATSQWEYAASASTTSPQGNLDPEYNARILRWYSRPTAARLPEIGQGQPNYWGIHDLHGLIWEWTADFNSAMSIEKYRAGGDENNKLFCAAGSVDSADPSDYAAFMRYGFRSSLQASFALPNLGFRCVNGDDDNENPAAD